MTTRDTTKPYPSVRCTLKIYEGEEDYLMDILLLNKYKDALREIISITDIATAQDAVVAVQNISALAKYCLSNSKY